MSAHCSWHVSRARHTTCALAQHRSECEFYLEHFVVQLYLHVVQLYLHFVQLYLHVVQLYLHVVQLYLYVVCILLYSCIYMLFVFCVFIH